MAMKNGAEVGYRSNTHTDVQEATSSPPVGTTTTRVLPKHQYQPLVGDVLQEPHRNIRQKRLTFVCHHLPAKVAAATGEGVPGADGGRPADSTSIRAGTAGALTVAGDGNTGGRCTCVHKMTWEKNTKVYRRG